MITKLKSSLLVIMVTILALLLCTSALQARGRRGGGGGGRARAGASQKQNFSRSGVARSGSLSGKFGRNTRPAPKPQRQNRKTAGTQVEKKNRPERNVRTPEQKQNLKDKQGDRQEWADKNREDRQDEIRDRQEDRQDFVEDEMYGHHRYHHDWDDDFAAGVVVGAAVVGTAAAVAASTSTAYITTLPCKTVAIVASGASYYHCGTTWYQRGYAGSQVTYIVVGPPPGH